MDRDAEGLHMDRDTQGLHTDRDTQGYPRIETLLPTDRDAECLLLLFTRKTNNKMNTAKSLEF